MFSQCDQGQLDLMVPSARSVAVRRMDLPACSHPSHWAAWWVVPCTRFAGAQCRKCGCVRQGPGG